MGLIEQRGVEYIAQFALRVSSELRREHNIRGDSGLIKAAEDLEGLLENNGFRASYTSKYLQRGYEKKKVKEMQFLSNIRLFKKTVPEEDGYMGIDRQEEPKSKKNKEQVRLKKYHELRELAYQDLNFKIKD